MGLRTIHLIGLIVGAMMMWDQSLLVETASDKEDKKASGVSRSRLPPDIAVPLPYVYPEYVDPREQTTAAPSTTEDNRAEQTTSVSEIILENVRQTMLVSTPMEEFVPIVHKNTVQAKNRHVTSTMRIMISNDNNDEPIAKQMINNKPVEEIKRPFGRRPNRFGTRLRTSTSHSMKQNFIKSTTTSTTPIPTTPIPKCINEADNKASASSNNNLPNCEQSSSSKTESENVPINGTRNVTFRRRPASRTRQVIRRVKPNGENARTTHRSVRRLRVKNAQSDSGMQRDKAEEKVETETAPQQ